MPNVFISFSSKDTEKARNIKCLIEKRGIECWFAPENIKTGESYLSTIPGAISGSDAFVLLLSDASQQSFWVKNEVESAINKRIPIFPIMIENCDVTEEFQFCLSHIQIFPYNSDLYNSVDEFVHSFNKVFEQRSPVIESTSSPENKKSVKKTNNGKLIAALCFGWAGVFINLLFLFLVFPYTLVQTVVIIVIMIFFSAKKYGKTAWIISFVCSILSLSVLNIVSSALFYDKCIKSDLKK